MSYLVLARKYRPQTFETILGQDFTSRALGNAVLRGRIPHALLFSGPRGVGKTTSARVFARSLNCLKIPDEATLRTMPEDEARRVIEPCGECSNCIDIARSVSLAVWEIDGASNNSVENVRTLIESLRSLPPSGYRYKVYIIDEVHMLSTAAFNALLKSLEEPPPNTVFIFATTDPQKVPETVLSRCQRYDFRRLSAGAIASQLRDISSREGISISDDVLTLIARKADGGMRDAQSMLDRLIPLVGTEIDLRTAEQVFGFVDSRTFVKLAGLILAGDTLGAFSVLSAVFEQSVNIRSFAADFLAFWRNLLLVSFAGRDGERSELQRSLELTGEELSEYGVLASQKERFDIQRLFDLARQTVDSALLSNFPRFVFEAGVAKMSTLADLRPIGKILSQLEGLEAGAPRATAAVARAAVGEKELPETPTVAVARAERTWVDFVEFIKAQNEPALAAFLRRVTPRNFSSGTVHLEANSFDVDSLKEPERAAALKRCLTNYFGRSDWDLQFFQHAGRPRAEPAAESAEMPVVKSIAAREAENEQNLHQQIDREAREDPFVQSALAAFAGSAIERVSVLSKGKGRSA